AAARVAADWIRARSSTEAGSPSAGSATAQPATCSQKVTSGSVTERRLRSTRSPGTRTRGECGEAAEGRRRPSSIWRAGEAIPAQAPITSPDGPLLQETGAVPLRNRVCGDRRLRQHGPLVRALRGSGRAQLGLHRFGYLDRTPPSSRRRAARSSADSRTPTRRRPSGPPE